MTKFRFFPLTAVLVSMVSAAGAEPATHSIRAVTVEFAESGGDRPGHREQLQLALRGDGGLSKIEARSGDFDTTVGVRIDSQRAPELVAELTVRRTVGIPGKGRVVFNFIGRVDLARGKRIVFARHVGADQRATEVAVTAE